MILAISRAVHCHSVARNGNARSRPENVEKFVGLALIRNQACQRGPAALLRSLCRAALVTIHESPEWFDTPRDSASSRACKELIKVTGRSVSCNLYFRPLSSLSLSLSLFPSQSQRGWIRFNVPRKCFVIDRARGSLATKCFFRQCQSRTTGRSTSVNISDACSGRSDVRLINRIIRRSRGSLKVHLSDDRAPS